jgi:hypothetical protein
LLGWGAFSDERTGLPFTIALVLASTVIRRSESRWTRDHILLSQIRDSHDSSDAGSNPAEVVEI